MTQVEDFTNNVMNAIDVAERSHSGRKLMCTSQQSWRAGDATKYLIIGQVYTFGRTEVHDEYTLIYVEEVPKIGFNSLCFSPIDFSKQ